MSSGRKRGRGPDVRERRSRAVASATAAAAKKGKKAEEVRQSASAGLMRNFLLGKSASEVGSTAVDSAASSSSAASSASGAHDPAQMGACLPTLYEQEMEEAADDDAAGPSTVPADPPPPPPIVTLSPDSVLAELDNEDQVESMDGKESVMFIYLHAIVRQLKKECSTTGKAVPGDVEWLLPLLFLNKLATVLLPSCVRRFATAITAEKALAAHSDLCESLLVSNSRSHFLTQSSREPYSRDHKSLVTLGSVPKLRSTMHNETMARLMR